MKFFDLVNELKSNKKNDDFITFSKKILKTNLDILGVPLPKIKEIIKKNKNEEIEDFVINYSYETNFIYLSLKLIKCNSLEEAYIFLNENINLIDSWSFTDSTFKYIKLKSFNIELPMIKRFIDNDKEFISRYGYLFLFNYLKDETNLETILSLFKDSKYFYVNLCEAWVISYLFIYHFDKTYNFLLTSDLSLGLKLKSISKALESFRVSKENKDKLKELRNLIKLEA